MVKRKWEIPVIYLVLLPLIGIWAWWTWPLQPLQIRQDMTADQMQIKALERRISLLEAQNKRLVDNQHKMETNLSYQMDAIYRKIAASQVIVIKGANSVR